MSDGLLFNMNLIFGSGVAISGLSFLTAVIIARALGPEGRGVSSLYQSGVGLVYAFLSVGVAVAALYFVSKGEVSQRQAMEAGISITAIAALVTAAIVGLLTIVAGDQIQQAGVPLWLLLVAVPGVIQFRVAESVLRSRGRFVAVSVIEMFTPFTTLVVLAGLAIVDELNVGRAVTTWTVANVFGVGIAYVYLGPANWPHRPAGVGLLRKMLLFGIASQLGNIIQFLNYRLDSYLVLLFVNSAGVGLYAVGVGLSEALWLIANSVSLVLIPRLTAADDEYVARMTPLAVRTTLLASTVAACGLAAISPFFIPAVFGEAFKGSVAPFLWLLPGTIALSASKILSAYVFSRGRPLINSGIAFATFAMTMVADLALIPVLEVKGAAIASSLAYVMSLALTALAYGRLSGRPVSEALLPRPSDLGTYLDTARSLLERVRPTRAAESGAGGRP